MTDKLDTYDLQQKWDNAFPSQRPADRLLLMVVWDNFLSENGDIKRLAQIRLRALRDGFDKYIWRIPHLANNRRPFGIRVSQGNELIPFNATVIEDKDKSLTEITVLLQTMKKGDEVFFTIEYYEKAYIKLVKRKLFLTQWEYNWVYKFLSTTHFFEMRVYLPKSAKVDPEKVRSSLSKDESITKIDDRLVYISCLREPPPGNKTGCVPYELPSPALAATISLIAGLLLAVPLSLITDLPWQWATVVSALVAAGIYGSHWVTEKIQ